MTRALVVALLAVLLVTMLGIQPVLAQDPEQGSTDSRAEQAAEESANDEEEGDEEEGDEEEATDEGFMDVIEVKGFRQSLQESVELKRDAVNTRDSIVTEDIGKMPDLNVAEAIQRVPGVTIVREGGEGRQLSLRGLDSSFTRVTLNGMEVPASTGGLDSSGGVNRGRGFDFNVFPAEL
ncbi:MAG: TonB-dependent receptor plug domain-containing protein, partial [Acidobacteriota bacterium]|nr:TonB-dependent receptor plug domain-containing protein [Acidobacteriota bacterium]